MKDDARKELVKVNMDVIYNKSNPKNLEKLTKKKIALLKIIKENTLIIKLYEIQERGIKDDKYKRK